MLVLRLRCFFHVFQSHPPHNHQDHKLQVASINHWERSPAQLEVQAQQLQRRSLQKISDQTTTTKTTTTSIIRTKTTTTAKATIGEDQPRPLQHQQSHPRSPPAVAFSTQTISKEVPNKRKRKYR